jgi:hypothetical protein
MATSTGLGDNTKLFWVVLSHRPTWPGKRRPCCWGTGALRLRGNSSVAREEGGWAPPRLLAISSSHCAMLFFSDLVHVANLDCQCFGVLHMNFANVSYGCCKENWDCAMIHMFHTHVLNMLSGCCIFNERIECSNKHETYVAGDVANINFRYFRCLVSILQTIFLDVADMRALSSGRNAPSGRPGASNTRT